MSFLSHPISLHIFGCHVYLKSTLQWVKQSHSIFKLAPFCQICFHVQKMSSKISQQRKIDAVHPSSVAHHLERKKWDLKCVSTVDSSRCYFCVCFCYNKSAFTLVVFLFRKTSAHPSSIHVKGLNERKKPGKNQNWKYVLRNAFYPIAQNENKFARGLSLHKIWVYTASLILMNSRIAEKEKWTRSSIAFVTILLLQCPHSVNIS